MRETCKPPTASLDGVPHDHTLPRHSHEGGNPRRCVHTPGWTALRLPSTEFDRIRQKLVCARTLIHARVRTRGEARFPPTETFE